MKKFILIILLAFILIPNVNAEVKLAESAKSSILIEATTGEIIYESKKDEKFAPASMTKIMSLIIIMEEIEKGNLKWNEEITVSKNASSMGGSQIYLEEGEKMSVKDLVKGICMASANDAVVALAERISGSEEAFVFRMNENVKKLGLKNTNFKNATGLDVANHYSSAYDMSMMARELVKHKKILDFSGIYEDYLRQDTDKKFWLVNTNRLIKTYDGMDGLKTGYTKEAGYCLTATAKRGDMRLIGVVMGEETSSIRNEEMTKLLDYGFNLYNVSSLVTNKTKLGKYENSKMKLSNVNIVPSSSVNVLNKKGDPKRKVSYKLKVTREKLPIKKGEKIGKMYVYENGKKLYNIDITVDKDVKKANILDLYIKSLGELFTSKYIM